MKKEFSSSASWNSAAVAGLVMAAATIILDYLPTLALAIGSNGVFGTLLVYLIKIAKIVGCIYLFRLLMLRFFNCYETDYVRLQNYGLKTALFSSILVAGFSLLQMLVINPDTIALVFSEVQRTYQNMMDSNTMAAMEKMMSKLPAMTFVFSLVYCYLWGWILSTAYARRLFPIDPFGDRAKEDTDNDNNQQ